MRKRLGFDRHTSCYKLIMLRSRPYATSNKPSRCTSIFLVVGLCCFFFELGAWQMGGFKGDTPAIILNNSNCTILPDLFDTHHGKWANYYEEPDQNVKVYEACDASYVDYTPCQDKKRAMNFPRENVTNRERHCPSENEKLYCLIPAPEGYLTPFSWPKCRDYVPYANVPYKSLMIEKAAQNWILLEGNLFKFPGGGTMFPKGADAYIDELASVIPIANGTIRTVLDIGCGVASWGAYLFKRNVLAMSFAPRDSDEAQVQFALERGVPAVIGVLGTMKLPYPSGSFDIAHCSHCQIPWTADDGMYLMEVDRVLRPGGYWILSGPPINWKTYYQTWHQSKEDAEKEHRRIEELAKLLCWDKLYEKGNIAIWRKKLNTYSCPQRQDNKSVKICDPEKVHDVWYKELSACTTPLPEVSSPDEVAGGQLKKFPDRLFAVPPRIARGYIPGVTEITYSDDNILWKRRTTAYKKINKFIGTVRYRNMMDMNAGLGGFAASIESPNSWVMNVVPTISQNDTLGIIYERGLIGIYHDWCEAFSTYPRTYDFIHANGIFSLYGNKCKMEDILLEMDRILRPEGAVVFRDDVEVLREVTRTATGMRWKVKMLDHEDGPHVPEKILLAVKVWQGK